MRVSLCALSTEPTLGTARAKRLEENVRSCRNCRHIYSFLAGAAAVCVCVCVLVAQSCPTLCDPMDCSLPGSFVHGILQARILEWVAISFTDYTSQYVTTTFVNKSNFCIHMRCFQEKAMAPHSSTLAWKIPWTEEPGRLQSMGSLGVRHD